MYRDKKRHIIHSKHLKESIKEVAENNGLDFDNGDVLVFTGKKAPKEKDAFVKVMQKALELTVEGLSPVGCKMLMYFISKSYYGNFVEVDQVRLMSSLKMSRTSVNKSLKELKELGIISITPDMNDKRRNTYMINPHTAWKGKPKERIIAMKKYKETFVNPLQSTLFLGNGTEIEKDAFLDLPNEKPKELP
jgi:DNA-binding MarR family transcriptional regulator